MSNYDIQRFIANNLEGYHARILDRLLSLKLSVILRRKNPYLFTTKRPDTAYDFVKSILDAHLSSQEEGIFGSFLEQLAIYVCSQTYNGRKSSAEGIDLEFERQGTYYIVSIKSGPNWGNSGQIAKMKDNFKKATRILKTDSKGINVIAVNGCCYGEDRSPDKGDYLKLCGQKFWELISGDGYLFIRIVEVLASVAQKNQRFTEGYRKMIDKFTSEFSKEYCDESGAIDWKKIVAFTSGYAN